MRARDLANPAFLAAMAVLLVCAVGMSSAIRMLSINLQKRPIYAPEGRLLRALPTETANWKRIGTDQIESAENLEVLGTENYITRAYAQKNPAPGKAPIVLYFHATYHTGMVDTVPHVPERCFVGGGLDLAGGPWTVDVPMDGADWIEDGAAGEALGGRVFQTRLSNEYSPDAGGRRVRLPRGLTPRNPLALRVSRYVDGQGSTLYAGYVFLANGGWVPSAEGVRLLAFDLRSTYAYYVKVQVNSAQAGSPEDLARWTGMLLDDLMGELMRCVPDWAEVVEGRYPARERPENG